MQGLVCNVRTRLNWMKLLSSPAVHSIKCVKYTHDTVVYCFFCGNDVNDTWTRVFYLPIFFRVTSSCQWSNMQIRWESMWLVKYVNQLYFPSLNVKWLWKVFLYFWAVSKELLFRLFMHILHIVKHVPVDKFSGGGGGGGGGGGVH